MFIEENQDLGGGGRAKAERQHRRLAKAIRRAMVLAATIGLLGGSLSVAPDGRVAGAEEPSESCMPTPSPGWRCGYITVPGGNGADPADLFYYLRLPTRQQEVPDEPGTTVTVELPGPFPTLLSYQGYGSSPKNNAGDSLRHLKDGYALMVVTIRGTGCSSGVWDPFHPQEAHDAKYVIDEWIAKQPW